MRSTHKQLGRVALIVLGFGSGCAAETKKDCSDQPGVICTFAGTGELGYDGDGNPPEKTAFYNPIDVMVDAKLGTYVVDFNNHRVRQLLHGKFKTVIGTDLPGDGPDDLSDNTPPGAPGTSVNLNHPTQLAKMPDGTLLLVSWHNHKLRSYDPATGLVTVVCGSAPGFGGDGGDAKKAKLNQPSEVAIADDGTHYILDQRNQVIRQIDTQNLISTLAGTPVTAGYDGDGGPATNAKLNFPAGGAPPPSGGVALDGQGNLYIADTSNHVIRKVDLGTQEITTIAGTGQPGFSGDGGPALKAKLHSPHKLTFGPDGRLYVADQLNDRIRAIDLAKGKITTVAGNGKRAFAGDGLLPEEASLNQPAGVSFGSDGAMYIVDTGNSRVRRVLPEAK